MIGFWGQIRAIAAHDLLIERRSGETWSIITPFAAAALVTIPMAIGPNLTVISSIGWPVYWSVGLLFGMHIAWRHTTGDRIALRDLVTLLGVDPAARFAGRAIASGLLLAGFMVTIGALTIFLYSPGTPSSWALLALTALLFSAGLAQIATLAADVTFGLGSRSTLAPLLVAP
ncbi:MAG: heme exporter protein CcmB, partial [Acidimicrobiia bacterium]